MTNGEDLIPSLQTIYGEDWIIRRNPEGIPAATFRGQITDDEVSKGLAMTLWEVEGAGPLADQLGHQTKLRYGL